MPKNNQPSKFVQVFLRAHTVVNRQQRQKPRRFKRHGPKWPKYVIVIDSETTRDTIQALTFGSARFCRWDPNIKAYVCIEEIYFYADELPEANSEGLACLRDYVA